jgi:protein-S-isoprenylcysteine O-methyltransferase Ste14
MTDRTYATSPLDHRIPPPFLTIALGVAMVGASFVTPTIELPWTLRILAGLGPFLAAAVFGPLAFAAFGRARTTFDPVAIEGASSLVTTGVYAWTRNPMYVALALLLVALAVWLASPVALLGPVAFVLFVDRFQIRPEERLLTARFGTAYEAYRRSVRRWL